MKIMLFTVTLSDYSENKSEEHDDILKLSRFISI